MLHAWNDKREPIVRSRANGNNPRSTPNTLNRLSFNVSFGECAPSNLNLSFDLLGTKNVLISIKVDDDESGILFRASCSFLLWR